MCKRNRLLARLHERALAALHVEDKSARALCELLREDGRGDKWNRRNRSRDVAESVELLVGGRYLVGLHRHRDADFLHNLLEVVKRKRGAVAGDRLELVGCSARDAKPTPRERGNGDTACRGERLDDERQLVADTASRMLVGGLDIPFEAATRLHHRFGEVCRLALVHPAAAHGHRERGHLVVGNFTAREAVDELPYLSAAERMPLALLVQYQLCNHADIIPNLPALCVFAFSARA